MFESSHSDQRFPENLLFIYCVAAILAFVTHASECPSIKLIKANIDVYYDLKSLAVMYIQQYLILELRQER